MTLVSFFFLLPSECVADRGFLKIKNAVLLPSLTDNMTIQQDTILELF
jgi:hypothetical protein